MGSLLSTIWFKQNEKVTDDNNAALGDEDGGADEQSRADGGPRVSVRPAGAGHRRVRHRLGNNQDEGDTQFTVRFRQSSDKDAAFLYGFVLFRQQRDASRTRGYLQKALVIVSEKPYVDLYDRVLRVTGPLFFTAGAQVLQALYDDIYRWPTPTLSSPVVLPLAGTHITCIIPQLVDYANVDASFDLESPPSSPSDHFIIENDAFCLADEAPGSSDEDASQDELENEIDDANEEVASLVEEGGFAMRNTTRLPSPSFGDMLLSKRSQQATAFEPRDTFAARKNVQPSDPRVCKVLRRCSSYMTPDATVLRQLVSPREVYITQTASLEDDPYVTINNAILRKVRGATSDCICIEPFEQYFGIWKSTGVRPHLYMSVAEFMKPFDLQDFLSTINPQKLPRQIRSMKWRSLYTAFIRSPHFEPWFTYRRARCVSHFANTMRSLRESVSPEMLLRSACGVEISREQCKQLKKEIKFALASETKREPVDDEQVRVIQAHLRAVKTRLKKGKKASK
ncbi:hypothetical protein FI667_g13712, partial [Globisporangium splendens]